MFANGVLHCDMALLNIWLQTAHHLVSHAGMKPLNRQLTFPGLHTDPTIDPGAAPSLLLGLLSVIGSSQLIGWVLSTLLLEMVGF